MIMTDLELIVKFRPRISMQTPGGDVDFDVLPGGCIMLLIW